MKDIGILIENNRRWSRQITKRDPLFFADLSNQQNPDYLWIGCSDSRVSANMIVGLNPGEIFVHRNVANLVNHSDMNCLSVIQFALEILEVHHIIVCGHYGCGGVTAALDGRQHGLIDNWLRHIQDTANLHSHILDPSSDHLKKVDRLCELNVARQVLNVCETTMVSDAWDRSHELTVHGWIYGLKDGLIRDQGISIASDADRLRFRRDFLFNEQRRVAAEA
jgi:carbonic anhydrase